MKIFRKKIILLPEEKQYYIWIFMFLFGVMLFVYLIFPDLNKIKLNMRFLKNYQKQIKEYESKTTNVLLATMKAEKDLENLDKVFGSTEKPLVLFNQYFLVNTDKYFKLKNVSFGRKLEGKALTEYPVYIDFYNSPMGIFRFIDKIDSFSFPMEVRHLEIHGLSQSRNFVTIQLIIKEKRNFNVRR